MEGKGSTNWIICARVQLKELRVQIYLVNECLCSVISELPAWAACFWGGGGSGGREEAPPSLEVS